MKWLVVLALMLALDSPAMLHPVLVQKVTISLGELVKTVYTPDGDVVIWRDPTGCTVVFRGVIVDRVDVETCQS